MNKQELIDKYEDKLKDVQLKFASNFKTKVYEGLVEDLRQLDEPQKVEIPQFVADWYKENKHDLEYNLWNYIMDWDEIEDDEFKNWFSNSKESFQTIINMHQFGYKIKKEKKYKVKFNNVVKDSSCLKYDGVVGRWYFGMESDSIAIRLYHTQKELEDAGFGEVFNSKMFEVKEVEE